LLADDRRRLQGHPAVAGTRMQESRSIFTVEPVSELSLPA
jgi:hypothetical protein